MSHETNFKPARGTAKAARAARRRAGASAERKAKEASKRRDGHRCRFPLCGCRRMRFAIESSHREHKGMGGNPAGDRSTTEGLITLCAWRHRAGRYAVDRGNLKWIPLTADGADGPVIWMVFFGGIWLKLACERAVQELEPLTAVEKARLKAMAMMEE